MPPPMENNDLGRALFTDSIKAAEEEGAIPKEDYAVAVDATFIDAPTSTKNNDRARDPEMASGRKAETWHFGMKVHVSSAVEVGIIRACVAGPANEHDAAAFGNDLFQCLYHNKKRPFRRMYICVKIALV